MEEQDNPTVLASNSMGVAIARHRAGSAIRDAASELYTAANAMRRIGRSETAERLEEIAWSLRDRFEIDEGGHALAYID